MSTTTTDIFSKNNTDDDDIISHLHESLISNILSRLETEDAVRTCILSKAWRWKWTSSYNVDINDCWWYHSSTQSFSEESFVNLMDRIVISSRHQLRSFHLFCNWYGDAQRMQTWISAVLGRSVENLEVWYSKRGFVLPCSLLKSTSLRTLKLNHLSCTLNVATKNCVPNLTNLILAGVEFVNGNANDRTVTFSFPVLETLVLSECKWLNVESVEIYAPSLTTVISEPKNIYEEYDYSIVIVAPRVTTFGCNYGLPEKIILNVSSIVSAFLLSCGESGNIELLAGIGLRVRNLINSSTSLEELEISPFLANVSRFGPALRRLDKLRRLTFSENSIAREVFELLHAAPSLKYMCLSVRNWDESDCGAMESLPPSCIVSELEEVVISGFYHRKPKCAAQYNLLKFLLVKAERLRKFTVTGYAHHHEPEELKEILTTFPRCSPDLTIEVVGSRWNSSMPFRWW